MSEHDNIILAELTADIAIAYVTKNSVRPADLPALLMSIHATLGSLAEGGTTASALKPPVPINRSVTQNYIVSLETGQQFRTLKRHLSKLGMTPAEYRAKWNLPDSYPMVAPASTAKRSALAKSRGFGRKLAEG